MDGLGDRNAYMTVSRRIGDRTAARIETATWESVLLNGKATRMSQCRTKETASLGAEAGEAAEGHGCWDLGLYLKP